VRGLAVLVTCAIAGCALHDVKRDPPPPIQLAASFGGAAGGGERAPDRWWTVFGDGALDGLVAQALVHNFQLAAAWARIDQARAGARQLGHTLPEITASASASRQKNRFDLGEPIGEITPTTNAFSAQLAAAYELDVWKKLGSAQRAVELDAAALRDDVEAIAMTLAAEITEAWLDVRAARARADVLGKQHATNQESLALLEERFRAGLLPSILDVYQQRSLVAQIAAQIVGARAQHEVATARLAVLLGSTPSQLAQTIGGAASVLPSVPALPAAGMPADLLDRRPDVRAARRRVEAADHRVAAAVADRLPSLRVQGSTSLQSSTIGDFVKSPLWSLLAAITAPLWDNGRRAAAVDQQRAIVRERVADYGQVMVQAIGEVEAALAQESHQLALLEELLRQRDLATATVREARDRYREGHVEYLSVLSALQAEQRLEVAVLDARREHLSLRVRLYRALGGTWTRELKQERP
jgi:NodT family efflux transporter outer membrane factor (OMF) lipoprotein